MPRRFAIQVLSALCLTALAGTAQAQNFPTRPVKFIVPFPPGGINDTLARIVADKLQARWGQPVVIENKTGAGGNIGADLAAQAEPDGYTLMVAPPAPLAVNRVLYKRLTYNPEDFTPISGIGKVPNLFIVRKELPVNSVKELIEYVKKNPGSVKFGSQGNGGTPHLTANMFMTMTDTQMVHVPYRGETLVLQDMLGGHVDLFFGNVSAALALWRDGRVKVLAVTDTARTPVMPDVPTSAEAGLPGFVSAGWFAMVGPPKLPATLQSRISAATVEILNLPDVKEKLRALSIEPIPMTPAQLAAFIKDETARWGDVIRKTGVVVD